MLGAMLLSWNNIHYYQQLMQGVRDAIEAGRYAEFCAETEAEWERGDIAPL
jgi:queuine tRNA-ribosyltransferase